MKHERITRYSTHLNIYSSAIETTCALIRYINETLAEQPDKIFNIAFSCGLTSSVMFDLWSNEFVQSTPWDRIHFWFVDECCNKSGSSNTNFTRMYNLLLSVVPIPEENVFRIQDSNDPEKEALRYSTIAKKLLPQKNKLPVFDLIILEIDPDGHLSSLSSGHLLTSANTYELAYNPYNRQKQIVLTGKSIINSRKVVLLATGKKLSGIIKKILSSGDLYPVSYVLNHASNVEIFMDKFAAGEILEEGE